MRKGFVFCICMEMMEWNKVYSLYIRYYIRVLYCIEMPKHISFSPHYLFIFVLKPVTLAQRPQPQRESSRETVKDLPTY